jgi:hypothetical protein
LVTHRGQRLIFDLGGAWFQAITTLGLCALYALFRSPVLLLTLSVLDVGILWVLTPVAKSDGYWVLADLLSVSSLEGVVKRSAHRDVQRGIKNSPARRPRVARRVQSAIGATVAASIFLGEQWLIWSMVIHFSQAYTDAVPAVTTLLRQGLRSASGVIVAHEVARLFFPLALIIGLLLCCA